MDHLDVEIVHQLLSGRLDPTARANAESHLKDCGNCRDLVQRERSLLDMLRLDDRSVEDPSALGRLLDRVEEAEPGGAARRRHRRKLKMTARVVAVLAAAWGVYWFRPQVDRNQETARVLGISVRQQMSIVSQLDALSAFGRERWLLANYETVVSLDELIREGRE